MKVKFPIRVVLADDHAMVRQSLASVLDACEQIDVVGQAGDGVELREKVHALKPDCLVMDYSMPDHKPEIVATELLQEHKSLKILVLTVHENAHYAVRSLQAGAHGYLIKSAAVEELVAAIETIRSGDVYISRKISAEVWQLLRRPRDKRSGLESLSHREFEVLKLLAHGATLQECATELKISVSTVSTYRSRVLEKLGLGSTAELVRFVVENKLLDA